MSSQRSVALMRKSFQSYLGVSLTSTSSAQVRGWAPKLKECCSTEQLSLTVAQDVYVNNRLSVALLQDDLISSYVGFAYAPVTCSSFLVLTESRTNDPAKGLVHLTESMTHPDYAFSRTADKTNFSMVHGKPVFALQEHDVCAMYSELLDCALTNELSNSDREEHRASPSLW